MDDDEISIAFIVINEVFCFFVLIFDFSFETIPRSQRERRTSCSEYECLLSFCPRANSGSLLRSYWALHDRDVFPTEDKLGFYLMLVSFLISFKLKK